MTNFTDAEIRKLAKLSKLKLTEDEIIKFKDELSHILSFVEILKDVDVSGLEPTSQVTGLADVFRDDEEVDYKIKASELLKNVPEVEDGQIKVKRMI